MVNNGSYRATIDGDVIRTETITIWDLLEEKKYKV